MKKISLILVFICPIFYASCKDTEQIEAAKKNSIKFGETKCKCEKIRKADPEASIRECTAEMETAVRYMNINFELGNISDSDKKEIAGVGDATYAQCMGE
ncbi:MAG: hypothetical protein KDK41_02560 [Leptospiraceae bacterium]|nr:hypothetical protein [Leptospiraceae bacterium]